MNLVRTAMLLAFMTALFMFVGFLIGGRGGMMIAFLVAAGMNFFSYWNSGNMVLSAYRAQEVDERNAPEFYGIVRDLARNAGLPMPRVYLYEIRSRMPLRLGAIPRMQPLPPRPAFSRFCRRRKWLASWRMSSPMFKTATP